MKRSADNESGKDIPVVGLASLAARSCNKLGKRKRKREREEDGWMDRGERKKGEPGLQAMS